MLVPDKGSKRLGAPHGRASIEQIGSLRSYAHKVQKRKRNIEGQNREVLTLDAFLGRVRGIADLVRCDSCSGWRPLSSKKNTKHMRMSESQLTAAPKK
jgi:hypothetical protein